MKKIGYFTIVFLLMTSCVVKKKPIFKKIDGVQVVSVTSEQIQLKANALFENPNTIGGEISTDNIKVLVNGAEVAQVSSAVFKVPARKEFSIPLKITIPTKNLFKSNKNGFLGGLLNAFLAKHLKVQFKGALRYKVWGFSKVYPIDKTAEIKIKL